MARRFSRCRTLLIPDSIRAGKAGIKEQEWERRRTMGWRKANNPTRHRARAILGAAAGLLLLAVLPASPTMAAAGDERWPVAQDHLHVAPNIGPHGHSQTPPTKSEVLLAPARAHERPVSNNALSTPRPAAAISAVDAGPLWAGSNETPCGHTLANSHRPRAPPRA